MFISSVIGLFGLFGSVNFFWVKPKPHRIRIQPNKPKTKFEFGSMFELTRITRITAIIFFLFLIICNFGEKNNFKHRNYYFILVRFGFQKFGSVTSYVQFFSVQIGFSFRFIRLLPKQCTPLLKSYI